MGRSKSNALFVNILTNLQRPNERSAENGDSPMATKKNAKAKSAAKFDAKITAQHVGGAHSRVSDPVVGCERCASLFALLKLAASGNGDAVKAARSAKEVWPFNTQPADRSLFFGDWSPDEKQAKNDADKVWRTDATGKGPDYRARQAAKALADREAAAKLAEAEAKAKAKKSAKKSAAKVVTPKARKRAA